ncbi:MAG: [FeFe] hydrogenase H-cluster radical SAM maturase HydG [Patescibacteria group bacterium]|nr:[FeFe] hydrogenase H-cluster radical SAM maturase HydG [Patescibacteria group bacterium]
MPNIKEIIDEEKIEQILESTKDPSSKQIEEVLKKAEKKKGLSLKEVGLLINVEDQKTIDKIFEIAGKIKNEIYGERLVLFAPLYISSFCINDCDYCGFHRRNKSPRKKLTMPELREQVEILEDMGHKRLLLEFGEDPKENPIDYVVESIKEIYKTKSHQGEIRRVNVNIAATTVENYRKLKKAGIGTYQLFQETYHKSSYKKLHNGPKENYERQLFAHNHAFEAGIDDVGLGVLFGLYDYKFEVLALISHAQYLDKKFGVGPHTFSVPRFQPADSVDMDMPYKVSEEKLLKIIAILRLAVPYTGMIISTRERPEIRAKAFKIGISQTSAGSRTSPGGYGHKKVLEQFNIADERDVPQIIESVLGQNLLPSFCTACYRQGRTGEKFMTLAKPGDIHNLCRPNAILTFKEYLEDYANAKIKKLGQKIIEKYLNMIEKEETKKETIKRLERIEKGERDLYF